MWKPAITIVALALAYSGISEAEQRADALPQSGAPKNGAATAADGILVLDASGSMWGQINGRHKILIARDVIGDLLDNLPSDHRLGLMAYGHNRKSDCEDIEMISEVGASREAIRSAVNNLKPLGMTPLSASVRKAAEVLRYKENAATVILVSDGEETCNIDPCELGRTLEASGVDFTAHVIGFDLSTDAERAQLQCLAEATGGTYSDASNADELSDALQETIAPSAAIEELVATRIYLKASDLDDGPIIQEGLRWKVSAASDDTVVHESSAEEGELELLDLAQGRYIAEVTRKTDGASDDAEFFIYKGDSKTLTLALEIAMRASVRTEPEESAPAGSEILVHWEGPEREGDWIALAKPNSPEHKWLKYQYVSKGNPVALIMPIELGEYEVRYIVGRPVRQLASTKISATSIGATVQAPQQANAGSMIDVPWTGPDYKGDWIGLANPGDNEKAYLKYTYTRSGSPLQLQTPIDAGDYEVRYVASQGPRVLARQLVTVNDIKASLNVPESAVAGSNFELSWTGPNYKGDWIATVKPGKGPGASETYVYTRSGSPLQLRAPARAGDYVVKYVTQSRVLFETTIKITAVVATLSAPASASVGTTISMNWTGPNYKNDYITIAKAGTGARKYTTYQYTKTGSPVELELPDEPGSYEDRYIQSQGEVILAREPIEVTESN